jgi:PAS domain S-box-containing protein
MFIRPARDGTLATKGRALAALQTKVMLADNDLNVTFVNDSAMALMREAELELSRELPRFSTATLVGSNIDVFHKTPDHQRTMLARLETQHRASIQVGRHTFDLIVTPLKEDGRRIGYAVEWADAAQRIVTEDYVALFAAINRSQAVIQFSPDGIIQDANQNFLALMGYALKDLVGQHHSMLVEPAWAKSPAYAAFWETMRGGKYFASQMKRITKNGKPVWLEASYNPVIDASGKVLKVVKFAAEITAQIDLLDNLKISLEQIEQSVSRSTIEAETATGAAQDASAGVQSVAASAEQVASAAQEIALSMSKSREAAEDVAAQAAAVGSSTEAMAMAAQAMNGIVGLIRNVASQINLLALNATIEAARAGEAGRGFAVVASEVKNLAVQAARATEKITSEIDGLQSISGDVARAIAGISGGVATVREQVTLTAAAVEEQTAVTQGMSASMQSASASVDAVSSSICKISASVQDVSQAVAKTKGAAKILSR